MREDTEILIPEYDNGTKLWAFCGLAFYRANVLEQGVPPQTNMA